MYSTGSGETKEAISELESELVPGFQRVSRSNGPYCSPHRRVGSSLCDSWKISCAWGVLKPFRNSHLPRVDWLPRCTCRVSSAFPAHSLVRSPFLAVPHTEWPLFSAAGPGAAVGSRLRELRAASPAGGVRLPKPYAWHGFVSSEPLPPAGQQGAVKCTAIHESSWACKGYVAFSHPTVSVL